MNINLTIESLESWGGNTGRPLIISGPCSAETEEQMLSTARQLKTHGIGIFRAGIWKPRTRPNQFEGVGSIGLKWLRQVKNETGMMTAVEVANVKHVYEALKMGVDILWIGARTSANPFSIQEIADSLEGVDIPVLVKNPVNQDLDLWIGAIERIAGAGITKLAAIHRGFSSSEKTIYRNAPKWELVIELRQRLINIPVICDPSHIAGRADLVCSVSQQAMDLGHDGLMIESHPEPVKALSDSKQQLTPDETAALIKNLIIRSGRTDNAKYTALLMELRSKIDSLDDKILSVIQKRMDIVKEIGITKKMNNVQILQTDRWTEILETAKEKGSSKGLSNEFIEKLFNAMHQESISVQTEILNSVMD
ncbi:MAG TPA: bifunctional 3-deoxy-7-phosphoheptulonate synthase/chorismate mutase type II [Ignavibacteria bacterium]|nr:bifunctional 3-deoxy-7-phosphoheptulonate synthase/chorismate mutase type II [Ignavibacteria bacterium]